MEVVSPLMVKMKVKVKMKIKVKMNEILLFLAGKYSFINIILLV